MIWFPASELSEHIVKFWYHRIWLTVSTVIVTSHFLTFWLSDSSNINNPKRVCKLNAQIKVFFFFYCTFTDPNSIELNLLQVIVKRNSVHSVHSNVPQHCTSITLTHCTFITLISRRGHPDPLVPWGHPEPQPRLVKVWVKDLTVRLLCLHLGPWIKHQLSRRAPCLKA